LARLLWSNLADAVSKVSGMNLSKARSFKDADGGGSIRTAFAQVLSDALTEAQKRHKGAGLFDFTDSSASKQLEANLSGLMVGSITVRTISPDLWQCHSIQRLGT